MSISNLIVTALTGLFLFSMPMACEIPKNPRGDNESEEILSEDAMFSEDIISTKDTMSDLTTNQDSEESDSETVVEAPSEDTSENEGTDFVPCETLSETLNAIQTRVMILEDKSGSMSRNNKWTLAMAAIDEMVSSYEDAIHFGLDLFARGTETNTGLFGFSTNSNSCAVGESVVHDVALHNASVINEELNNWFPNDATPLLLAMENYTDSSYAPFFLDGTAPSYLVIISDGKDTCGAGGVFDRMWGATPEQLADVANTLRTSFDVQTIAIGFGEGAAEGGDGLNAIAEAGGTPFTEYLHADDGEGLKEALSTIAKTVAVSCEFEVGGFTNDNVNYDLVIVTFNGIQIPRDDGCANGTGWTWIDESHSKIEFCSTACENLENEDTTEVLVQLACSEDDVIVAE